MIRSRHGRGYHRVVLETPYASEQSLQVYSFDPLANMTIDQRTLVLGGAVATIIKRVLG